MKKGDVEVGHLYELVGKPVKISYFNNSYIESFEFGVFKGIEEVGGNPFINLEKFVSLDGKTRKGKIEPKSQVIVPFSLDHPIKITPFSNEKEMVKNYNECVSKLFEEVEQESQQEGRRIYKKYSENPIGFHYPGKAE